MPEEPLSNASVLASIDQNTEHSVTLASQNLDAIKALESPLEGILLKTHEIAKNTQPRESMKIQIEGIEVVTLKGDKGDKGDKGNTGNFDELTPEQRLTFKGDKGDAFKHSDFTLDELDSLRGPQGVPGENGVVGLQGATGPKGADSTVPGPKGADSTVPGQKGADGSPDTSEQVIDKIKNKFSYEDLKDWDHLQKFISSKKGVASKSYAVSEMTDVSMQGIIAGQLLQWNGRVFIPYTPSSSGVSQMFGETIGTSGSAAFTLANTPIVGTVRVYRGGGYQQGGGADYTITGASGTLSSVLQGGEILLADYNY